MDANRREESGCKDQPPEMEGGKWMDGCVGKLQIVKEEEKSKIINNQQKHGWPCMP